MKHSERRPRAMVRLAAACVLVSLSAACTYITIAPQNDAGATFDSQEASDTGQADKTQQDAFFDVLRDTGPLADVSSHDATQCDVLSQTDTMTQADVITQVDATPPPDAPCGVLGQLCCNGSECLHWPALDHSYTCDSTTGLCKECGSSSNMRCCPYTPRCASWLTCIYYGSQSGDPTDYRCKN